MAKVTIYTTPACAYCMMAKGLLKRKNIPYTEIDVSADATRRQSMVERAGGRRTVPQIFIGDTHVGGCDDLHELERAGQLDALLAA